METTENPLVVRYIRLVRERGNANMEDQQAYEDACDELFGHMNKERERTSWSRSSSATSTDWTNPRRPLFVVTA